MKSALGLLTLAAVLAATQSLADTPNVPQTRNIPQTHDLGSAGADAITAIAKAPEEVAEFMRVSKPVSVQVTVKGFARETMVRGRCRVMRGECYRGLRIVEETKIDQHGNPNVEYSAELIR